MVKGGGLLVAHIIGVMIIINRGLSFAPRLPIGRNTSPISVITTRLHSSNHEDETCPEKPKVIVIAGPTSVGKTRVAVSLKPTPPFIISADSVQVYEHLTIGANKPTEEELQSWGIDHRLIGTHPLHSNGDDVTTAASWYDATLGMLDAHYSNSSSPVVVCGGSMMYLDWLLHGMPMAPGWDSSNSTEWDMKLETLIETSCEASGWSFDDKQHTQRQQTWDGFIDHLYESVEPLLKSLTQALLAELKDRMSQTTKNDRYRLTRTLQIAISRSVSEGESQTKDITPLFTEKRKPTPQYDFRPFFLCPTSRTEHSHLIDKRSEDMISRGLLSEVGSLVQTQDLLSSMAVRSIGYRQAADYLTRTDFCPNDPVAFEEFLNTFMSATRRYAKQQMQWFRRDRDVFFVPINSHRGEEAVPEATGALQRLAALSREEWEKERDDANSMNMMTRSENEKQGKDMRLFMSRKTKFARGSKEVEDAVQVADRWATAISSSRQK